MFRLAVERSTFNVAPHVGAWIEIAYVDGNDLVVDVAPHVGAWIEISKYQRTVADMQSHPTWVRGLKLQVAKKVSIV